MSTTIALRHAAWQAAACDLQAAARLLHDSGTTAGRVVAGLLADWQGAAADSFAAAFVEWERAAAACLEALEGIRAGVALTGAGLDAADASSGRELDRLVASLSGRAT